MRRAVVTRPRTYLRKPSVADAGEFVARVAGSDHLAPWAFPPTDVAAFRQCLVLVDGEWRDHERWATDVEDWRAARRR